MIHTMPCTTSITKNINISFIQMCGRIYYVTMYHDQMTRSPLYIKLSRNELSHALLSLMMMVVPGGDHKYGSSLLSNCMLIKSLLFL